MALVVPYDSPRHSAAARRSDARPRPSGRWRRRSSGRDRGGLGPGDGGGGDDGRDRGRRRRPAAPAQPRAAPTAKRARPVARRRPVEGPVWACGSAVGSDGMVVMGCHAAGIPRAGIGPGPRRYQPGIGAVDSADQFVEHSAPCGWESSGRWWSTRPNGALSPRDRVVLSVLVLHGNEVVSAERLADALWGDDPPASAGKVVQGCVVRLRKALGPAAIETHAAGYRLALGADDVDLHRFERLLGRAREQLALRAPDRALRTAEEALALWRGRPFDDVEGWDAARIEAARLDELRHEAEELRVDAALRSGRHHEVLATARALVDAAPTRERRWELLALAQYRSGSQADALRTLHEARRRLADELGLDPGPGLVALEQAILRHDDELRAPTIPPVVDDTCPWPGLLAYSVDDADGFAGRDEEIEACLARLAARRRPRRRRPVGQRQVVARPGRRRRQARARRPPGRGPHAGRPPARRPRPAGAHRRLRARRRPVRGGRHGVRRPRRARRLLRRPRRARRARPRSSSRSAPTGSAT